MNQIELDQLSVALPVNGELRPVLRDVSVTLAPGEALGLVGESGSGKSMTARAIARLLPPGAQVGGSVRCGGTEVLGLEGRALLRYRQSLAMIFQDPRVHINPVRRIGEFLTEQLRSCQGVAAGEARRRAIEMLRHVGIDDGAARMRCFPHELSGGLLQRVMIAAALLASAPVIIADEPTTALDVTTQSEVMAILDELRRDRGLSLLFITHDLDLAAAVCDRTAVMYAGQIVEIRESARLHTDPLHPYTAALGAARPDISSSAARLAAIPGRPLSAFEAGQGCGFAPRCQYAQSRCQEDNPVLEDLDGGMARCLRASELHGQLAVVHP
ncbi:MAG: ABC transporter ATP-binding protein [Streptosporangiaceae bacterium]